MYALAADETVRRSWSLSAAHSRLQRGLTVPGESFRSAMSVGSRDSSLSTAVFVFGPMASTTLCGDAYSTSKVVSIARASRLLRYAF